jgi:hypothetical protein
MKATLNITLQGVSADYGLQIDPGMNDRDIKRLAVEVVRSGEVPGLHIGNLPDHTFDNYVVDRFDGVEGGLRLYLRPKVPFGAGA